MTLQFHCPNCGKKLKAREADAGRTAICSGCGNRVAIPTGESSPSRRLQSVFAIDGDGADESLVAIPPRKDPGDLIDMTPMVDVVLFLLIFFLVTSVQAIQAVIDMPTPQSTVDATSSGRSIAEYEQDPDYIMVRIEDDDTVWVEDEQTFADQDLRVRLRAAAAERSVLPSVLVVGNADASHGAAVRVFDACAYARVKEISFIVQEGERN
jgi:biopolymer transport protein ExbD/DNA-directed RNA polymerase subunit RPC12/RpoP